MGELVAVWSVFNHASETSDSVSIYTDSFAVLRGCTEWLPFWDKNDWEVNRVPAWQKEKWQEILAVEKKGNFLVGWVASHQENESPTSHWNHKVDEMAR